MKKRSFAVLTALSLFLAAGSASAALDTTAIMADMTSLEASVQQIIGISLGLVVAYALVAWVRRGSR